MACRTARRRRRWRRQRSLAPLSAPWCGQPQQPRPSPGLASARARRPLCGACVKIRCASAAEPTLTSMWPRSRAMSAEQERVSRALERCRQQPRRAGGLARTPTRCGRRRAETGLGVRVGGQVCRALVSASGSAVAAASLSAGADRGPGPATSAHPGPPAAAARCQVSRSESPRPARASASARCTSPSLVRRCGLVDRRTHQWMTHRRQRHRVVTSSPERTAASGRRLGRTEGRPLLVCTDGEPPVSSAAATSSSVCTGAVSRRLRSRKTAPPGR